MTTSYMLAGTASANPVLGALAILLILAWTMAGWIRLDHWILPALGTPWQRGTFRRAQETGPAAHRPRGGGPEPTT